MAGIFAIPELFPLRHVASCLAKSCVCLLLRGTLATVFEMWAWRLLGEPERGNREGGREDYSVAAMDSLGGREGGSLA